MNDQIINDKLDLILSAQVTLIDLFFREMERERNNGKEVIYFGEALQIVKENSEKIKELFNKY